MQLSNTRKVLITGASGLIGYWLTKELVEQGVGVVALVRDHDPQSLLFATDLHKKIAIVSGSLELETIERALCEHEVDTVFHLAAQTLVGCALRSPLATFESNVRGTYLLLEACRHQAKYLKSIVVASSDKAYGSQPNLPYKEQMPLSGKYPYDVSKSCCDLITQSYYHTYALPVTVVRCGNIYGGGDLHWSRIIPGTIKSLLSHQSPIIRSDGTFIRDYLYVKDAVCAYITLAAQCEKPGVIGGSFNFAPNRPHTALEIVNILRKMMGLEHLEPKILNAAQAEIKEQFLSSSKAEELLGWQPKYSLEEGLLETIEWYSHFLGIKHSELACR